MLFLHTENKRLKPRFVLENTQNTQENTQTQKISLIRGVKRSGAHDSQVERMLACCPFGAHGAQINFKKV